MKPNEISDILQEMNEKYSKSSLGMINDEDEDAGLDMNYLVSSSSKKRRKDLTGSKLSNRKQPPMRRQYTIQNDPDLRLDHDSDDD